MKKTIAILEDTRVYPFGGGQQITNLFINSLSESSEYEIIFFDDIKNKYFKNKINKKIKKYFYRTEISTFNLFKIAKNLVHSIFLLIKILKKKKDLILYAPTGSGLLFSVIYKIFNKKTKIIFHAHKSLPRNIFKRTLFKFFFKKCEKIIVVSKFLKKNFYNIRTELIYNTIPFEKKTSRKKIKINKKKLHIVMVANNFAYKNHKLFISLIKNLKSDNINFHLFGSNTEVYQNDLSLENRKKTFFHGYVDNPLSYFRKYNSLLLIPSYEVETFSLIILEAFSNKTLVVATKSGAHLELIDNGITGFHLKSLKIKDVLSFIEKILGSNNKVIKNNAYKFYKKNFSNKNFANSMQELIKCCF